jgi:hypothetical protein
VHSYETKLSFSAPFDQLLKLNEMHKLLGKCGTFSEIQAYVLVLEYTSTVFHQCLATDPSSTPITIIPPKLPLSHPTNFANVLPPLSPEPHPDTYHFNSIDCICFANFSPRQGPSDILSSSTHSLISSLVGFFLRLYLEAVTLRPFS